MRYATLVWLALAATEVAGSNWFSKSAYSKWQKTELERWLADHDVPYAKSADRKELESLVEKNWNDYVVAPYNRWSIDELTSYVNAKTSDAKEAAKETAEDAKEAAKVTVEETKDSLLSKVKASWYETEDKTQSAYLTVQDWIFDTWSDSQLKSFCDKHGIPVPQPHKRDTLLQKVRLGYENAAKATGETLAYPGNWLYQSWSDSDLKAWLESHGYPVPQKTTREKLIASVRRNSRLAYLKLQETSMNTSQQAQDTYAALTDKVLDAWTESSLKEFCDKNGIPVPQGTKINELRALIRKQRAAILGDTVGASAASAYGAATSLAGNHLAAATDAAAAAAQTAWEKTVETWSESQLKGFLDARGVPVPHASKLDELRALARKHQYKARSFWTAWTYDDMTLRNLRRYSASGWNSMMEALKSLFVRLFNQAKVSKKTEL